MSNELQSTDEEVTVFVVQRYHGTDDPLYRACHARFGAASVQGRGRCERCGHQVMHSPDALRMNGITKWCAQCALNEAGAGPDDYARLALDLSHCRELPCPFRRLD